jgi:hypothetical protein
MATEGEIKPDDIRNPDTRHELRQVNATGVMLFMLLLVVLGFFIHFAVLGLFKFFDRNFKAVDTNPSPIMTAEPRRMPPTPRLQPDPVGDLHEMREAEDRILHGYAWIDQQNGVVRIPIARAMQLLVQRGIPSRPPQPGEVPPLPMAPSGAGVQTVPNAPSQQQQAAPAVKTENRPPQRFGAATGQK